MSTKTNFVIDILIFVAFLVAYELRLTGVPIHEWLSLALFVAIVIHLASHWKWVVQITLKFFRQLFHSSRLNYVINLLFFISFIGVMLSGLLISRAALPALGFQMGRNEGAWRFLHTVTANASVILLALHFALHWDWIWNTLKKYVFAPIGRLFGRKKLEPVAAAASAAPPPAAKLPPMPKK
ncbi:MAG TPA: DUF4405 domain-containing protein [Thermoflexales bacterium]|nr:DUF4405 domain-containing protein [Thermoflexales bacterium]HQW35550.1 DUF4405 domain-containing protein [Thermoflexales bacterium]HQX76235.1 DUF4405 domain-containing protein [Thermoflexales bacterium]HQZ21576.1 DUF4405 domain-containing protein [Thermoflexales bacterium]HQZ99897.1 DUF4405 domain-containing protein [Thermoflexales bacterium]